MDSKKIRIAETENMGKGLFAKEHISKGEIIYDGEGGKVYEAESCNKLPPTQRDHAMQFAEHQWIDTKGLECYINHSCEPNCGIKGKFQVVAMRDIEKGEQLTYDYEMTEDSDWRMHCKCKTKSCRTLIGAFRNMPESVRKKYQGYISDWLREKYKL